MKTKAFLELRLFAVAFLIGVMAFSASAADTLRPEVGQSLQAAQDLIKQQKYKEALAKVAEADAVSGKTPYETFILERMRGTAAVGAGEADTAATAFDAVINSGRLSAEDQSKLMQGVAGTYYRAKNYDKAASWALRYQKSGGSDAAMELLLIQAYYLGGNYTAAAKGLQDQLDQSEKSNQTPTQDQLELLASCYLRQNDGAGYAGTLQKLVTYYPKKEYWADLLVRIQRKPGFSDRLSLDVFRLMLATGTLTSAADYMDMAQLALQAGLPTEAQKVINQGYTSKVLGIGADAERQKRLKKMADDQAREDQKTLESDAQSAQGKTSTAMINTGFNLSIQGKSEQGIALMEEGIANGDIKYPEEAKLHLGLAYLLAGNKAKAVQVFGSVQGNDGSVDIARLWTVVAKRS